MLAAGQEFAYAGQGRMCRGLAGFNGFTGAVEVIPGKRMDIGANDQVRVPLPGVQLMLLSGADRAANDLEDIFGRIAAAVLSANGHADNKRSAQLTSRLRRDWSD